MNASPKFPEKETLMDWCIELSNTIIPNEDQYLHDVKGLRKYLNSINNSTEAYNVILDAYSIGSNLISNFPDTKNTILTRKSIFNDIRSIGSKISNIPADKWNPGDIYAIDSKFVNEINNHIKSISLDNPEALGLLNDLFSIKYSFSGELYGSVVSVSLKNAQAQGGKGKGYFSKMMLPKDAFNVSPIEMSYTDAEFLQKIEEFRNNIYTHCNKSNVKIDLTQDKNFNRTSDKLLAKFAALKLVDILLSDPTTAREHLISIVGYSMSLSGINPTFFKVIGNSKGNTSKEEHNVAGETISLLENPGQASIFIIDSNTNSEVIMKMNIIKGEHHYSIQYKFRSNGNKQSTAEIQSIKHIK